MPSLKGNEKVTCENWGIQTTKHNLVCHKINGSVGTLYCTQCPKFSSKIQNDLNYHIAKKRSAQNKMYPLSVIFSTKILLVFYASRPHKITQYSFPIKTTNADPNHIMNEVDDTVLKLQLRSCQDFFVESQLELTRHKVFNYVKEYLNGTIVGQKFNHFINISKYPAKVNLIFGFNFWKLNDEKFGQFYEHRNKTLLERAKLVSSKDDLTKQKDNLNKPDVIKLCSRVRMIKMWRL